MPNQISPVGVHSCWVSWWTGLFCSPTARRKIFILTIFTHYTFYTLRDLKNLWITHSQPCLSINNATMRCQSCICDWYTPAALKIRVIIVCLAALLIPQKHDPHKLHIAVKVTNQWCLIRNQLELLFKRKKWPNTNYFFPFVQSLSSEWILELRPKACLQLWPPNSQQFILGIKLNLRAFLKYHKSGRDRWVELDILKPHHWPETMEC